MRLPKCPDCNIEMKRKGTHVNMELDTFAGFTDVSSPSISTATCLLTSTNTYDANKNDVRMKAIKITTFICPKCNIEKQVRE